MRTFLTLLFEIIISSWNIFSPSLHLFPSVPNTIYFTVFYFFPWKYKFLEGEIFVCFVYPCNKWCLTIVPIMLLYQHNRHSINIHWMDSSTYAIDTQRQGQSHFPDLPCFLIFYLLSFFYLLSLFPGPTNFLNFYNLPHVLDILTPNLILWNITLVPVYLLSFSITGLWLALILPSTDADLYGYRHECRSDSWSQPPALYLMVAYTHCWCQRCRHWPQEKLCYHNCKFESSLWLVNVPLFFPWWATRKETDWGLKTHQVFTRWLSEKDFQVSCQHSSLL